MYELLKKHIRDYAGRAESDEITVYLSATGNGPLIENGKVCFITPSLPTSDYEYLNKIIDCENQEDSEKYKLTSSNLKAIFDKLTFIKKNYTFPILCPNVDKESILDNFKQQFGFTDKSIRSFQI